MSAVITVADKDDKPVGFLSFCYMADFWEITHIITQAKRAEAKQQLTIDALMQDAVSKFSLGLGTSVAGGMRGTETSGEKTEGESVGVDEVLG